MLSGCTAERSGWGQRWHHSRAGSERCGPHWAWWGAGVGGAGSEPALLGPRADQPPRDVAAVQEERQRGKDRNENEVESTSSANEDMPVEKILEAELAVEPKTEAYVEANVGLNPSSVSARPCGPPRW